jgi:hypothetical protein
MIQIIDMLASNGKNYSHLLIDREEPCRSRERVKTGSLSQNISETLISIPVTATSVFAPLRTTNLPTAALGYSQNQLYYV